MLGNVVEACIETKLRPKISTIKNMAPYENVFALNQSTLRIFYFTYYHICNVRCITFTIEFLFYYSTLPYGIVPPIDKRHTRYVLTLFTFQSGTLVYTAICMGHRRSSKVKWTFYFLRCVDPVLMIDKST